MQVGKENRILILIFLCLAVALPGACTYKGGSGRVSEMQEFDSFFSTHSDSVVMAPRWMKAQALQRMERTKDSMVRYNYLAVALKTCLAISGFDISGCHKNKGRHIAWLSDVPSWKEQSV